MCAQGRLSDHRPFTGDNLISLKRSVRRSRFTRAVRNNPFAVPGLVIVFVFLLVALFPAPFTRHDPTRLNLPDKFLPPSSEHFAGTDSMGMDQYSRIIYGARVTLQNVTVVLAIAASVGYVIGSAAGFLGGHVDEVLMRITDVFLAFPSLILAIAVNSVLGRGLVQTMLAVGFSWWPSYARLIRGQILSVKYEEYVTAARAIAEPPTPEWGRMVAEGRDYLLRQWWVATFPGLALFLVVVGFNLFGEIVRDWLDPSGINR